MSARNVRYCLLRGGASVCWTGKKGRRGPATLPGPGMATYRNPPPDPYLSGGKLDGPAGAGVPEASAAAAGAELALSE